MQPKCNKNFPAALRHAAFTDVGSACMVFRGWGSRDGQHDYRYPPRLSSNAFAISRNLGDASCQNLVTGMQIFCNKYLLQTVRNTMYYRQPFLMLGFVGRVDVLPR
jgi:hypothetical protein